MALPVPKWMRRDDLVECRRSISVLDAPKQAFGEQWPMEDTRTFWSGDFHLEWRRDRKACDTYVELLNRGPKNSQSAFALVTTPCNYGGKRHWFECPRCGKRAVRLYEHNDDFFCRTCLGLQNASHLVNYHSIEPFVRRMAIHLRSEPRGTYEFYKGRVTKHAMREEKLRLRIEYGAPVVAMMLNAANRRAKEVKEAKVSKTRGRSF